jgi:adenylate kinase
MLAVLTGIPGTGKTTTAKKALEMLKVEGVNVEMITYGDIMFEIAKTKKLVTDRDQMRKLDPVNQKEVQKEAAKKIASMASSKNVLVDTHCTISTPKGYLPGLPEWVLRELKPNQVILVEARAEDIAARRNSDKTRQRDGESTEGIRTHQELNRAISMAYAVISGCTVKIIQNEQGKMDEAAKNMAAILK